MCGTNYGTSAKRNGGSPHEFSARSLNLYLQSHYRTRFSTQIKGGGRQRKAPLRGGENWGGALCSGSRRDAAGGWPRRCAARKPTAAQPYIAAAAWRSSACRRRSQQQRRRQRPSRYGHCARSDDAGTSFGCAAIAGGCSASLRRRCRTQPPALYSRSVIIPAQWRPTQVGRFTRRQSTVVERCTSALQCALQGCKVERVDAVKMPSSRVAQGRSWLRRCLACVGS